MYHFPGKGSQAIIRLSQLLKGAVVVTLCQNEADVKSQMDIDSSISKENFSSASFWQRVMPTAPFKE